MAEEIFDKQVDYKNKVVSEPLPNKITNIDTKGNFYDELIDGIESSTVDLNKINSFANVAKNRNEVYNLLDIMGEDPIISSALDIYASDASEPNNYGQIVWAESDDEKCLGAVNLVLDSINVNKNSYDWIYSLVKYGDLYLRLYRKSETDEPSNRKKNLNEDVIVKAFSKNDRYSNYVEMATNPAEVFDLTKYGKTYGYLKTYVPDSSVRKSNDDLSALNSGFIQNSKYTFNSADVDVYEATEFVHASLTNNTRVKEEVTIATSEEDGKTVNTTYQIKRGQSVLYNSFKIWRELSLLENAVLLNRMTKSSVLRTVSVEVGDMDPTQARKVVQRVKQMVEQKTSVVPSNSFTEYTNPGPMENTIYIPTHNGQGNVTTGQIGGDVEVGDLNDLDYWKKKLYASLSIPGQFLSDTDDSTGFNGGSSLSLISSRYAKTIKNIQQKYISAITDLVNLYLLDKGLVEYINKFTIRMQAPTTQEEKDRKDNENATIQNVDSVMRLLDVVDSPVLKLKALKSLLGSAISDENVIAVIQEEIDRLEAEGVTGTTDEFSEEGSLGDDLFGSEGGDLDGDLGGDFGSEDLGGELEGSNSSEELPMPSETEGAFEEDLDTDLPSFADLGVSYNEVR